MWVVTEEIKHMVGVGCVVGLDKKILHFGERRERINTDR